jgi:hypothetical protein
MRVSEQWLDLALRATKTGYEEKWRSAPYRLARLLRECTRVEQSDRMDFSLAVTELENLLKAVLKPTEMKNPELWAEEVLAHLPSAAEYAWDINQGVGRIHMERGVDVLCKPDFRKARVELQFDFMGQGSQHHKHLTQKIETVPQQVRRALEGGSWKWGDHARGASQLKINASIEVSQLIKNSDAAFKAAGAGFKAFESIGGV